MARRTQQLNISLSDVSFQLESFEILTFITVPTLQNYQFVAALNTMLEIDLRNNGVIEIFRKKQAFQNVIYSVLTERELLYILLDIRNSNLDKALKSYDKILFISGDYNKNDPSDFLVNNFQLHLPDTIECRRWDFPDIENPADKGTESMLKLLNGDRNNEGLLCQIEMHLKTQMDLEENNQEYKDEFLF